MSLFKARPLPPLSFLRHLPFYMALYAAWIVLMLWNTHGLPPTHAWLDSWYQWDALWYERIWNQGYSQFDHKALAFPPGYPFLIGALSELTAHSFTATAMVFNLCAFFIAMILAAELLSQCLNLSPVLLFLLALTSPAAFFAFPAYSESLFCLLLWASLSLALTQPASANGRLAAKAGEFMLLFLIPWVRITGYALAAWLVLRRWTALAVLLSLMLWLGLNHMIAGDAFYFLKTQKLFTMKEGHLLAGLIYACDGLQDIKIPYLDTGWQDYLVIHFLPVFYFFALGLCGLWFCWKRQWLIGLTLLAILFMSHNVYYWRSSVRYDLPLMPCLYAPVIYHLRTHKFWAFTLLGAAGAAQLLAQLYFANYFRIAEWAF